MAGLSRAFVVTISTSVMFACTPQRPLPGNPPLPDPLPEPSPDPEPTVDPAPQPVVAPAPQPETPPNDRSGDANPTDSAGRQIRLAYNSDSCFVYLPFPPLKPGEQRPPGSAPPQEKIACPPAMSDPAFKSCRGGVISFKGASCECFEPGNPPRVQPNPCPEG